MGIAARTAGVAAVAALLVLLASGCGSSNSNATKTTATQAWANDLCSAVVTYKDSLQSAAQSAKDSGLSKSALEKAAGDAKDATSKFVSTIKGLGEPDTESGATAKKTVDGLASDLQKDADAIEKAVSDGGSVTSILTVVATTASTAQGQINTAVQTLKDIDAKGEIKQAFKDSSACSSLTS